MSYIGDSAKKAVEADRKGKEEAEALEEQKKEIQKKLNIVRAQYLEAIDATSHLEEICHIANQDTDEGAWMRQLLVPDIKMDPITGRAQMISRGNKFHVWPRGSALLRVRSALGYGNTGNLGVSVMTDRNYEPVDLVIMRPPKRYVLFETQFHFKLKPYTADIPFDRVIMDFLKIPRYNLPLTPVHDGNINEVGVRDKLETRVLLEFMAFTGDSASNDLRYYTDPSSYPTAEEKKARSIYTRLGLESPKKRFKPKNYGPKLYMD